MSKFGVNSKLYQSGKARRPTPKVSSRAQGYIYLVLYALATLGKCHSAPGYCS